MKEYDDLHYLQHIMKASMRINTYIKYLTKTNFEIDFKTQDAVMRQLEIIGEVTKRISPQMRTAFCIFTEGVTPPILSIKYF